MQTDFQIEFDRETDGRWIAEILRCTVSWPTAQAVKTRRQKP